MKQSGVRLPEVLNKKLKYEAIERGISRNALILNILWDYVEKKGEKECIGTYLQSQLQE